MTEGIIQEVFNRYSVALVKTSMDKRAYDLLEKELIERIKAEFPENEDAYLNYRIRKAFIGDNQE